MSNYVDKNEEIENGFCKAVFEAKDPHELVVIMANVLWGTKDFASLPRFRQSYVHGYVQGRHDSLSGTYGRPLSKLPSRNEDGSAAPAWVEKLQPGAGWKRHPHGGGWVSDTAYVAGTAYVGPTAAVYDDAKVGGFARIYGQGRVFEKAEVSGAAHVHGNASVYGESTVCDAARVLGRAKVTGKAVVRGTAVVRDKAVVGDGAEIFGSIRVSGSEEVTERRSTYFDELRPSHLTSA